MEQDDRIWATGQDLLDLSLLDVVEPTPLYATDYTVSPPRQELVDNDSGLSETVAARLALRLAGEDEADDDKVRALLDDDYLPEWAEYKYQFGLGNRPRFEKGKVTLELSHPINGEQEQTLTFRRLNGRDIRMVGQGSAANEVREMIGYVARSAGITFESALLLRIGDLTSAVVARDFLILAGS